LRTAKFSGACRDRTGDLLGVITRDLHSVALVWLGQAL
jgi:hypothetical protein